MHDYCSTSSKMQNNSKKNKNNNKNTCGVMWIKFSSEMDEQMPHIIYFTDTGKHHCSTIFLLKNQYKWNKTDQEGI